MREHDRGQSELLGFALVFSFVIFTIVLVSATGFVGLNNAQDYQRTTNAEQAFTALAENVDDVARRGAPSRVTEIKLADASLSFGETETMTITVDDGSLETKTVEIQPVVYDSNAGTTIAYSNGALVRQDGDSSVMLRQPNAVLTDEVVILPVVATSRAGDAPVGGNAGVGVETRHTGTEVIVVDDASTVTVEVTSARIESWERYLDAETGLDCDAPVGETVTCEIDTQRVHVTITHVDVRFE